MKIVQPSSYVTEVGKEPFVTERFQLLPSTIDRLRSTSWSFGFGAFSEVVFHDNYAQRKADGTLETWPDVIQRVVEGCLSIRKDHYHRQRIKWDEGKWQEIGEEMSLFFLKLKSGPPGRGYFAMGRDFVYERGAAALINCCATKLHADTFDKDLGWIMDCLMCGGGVSAECVKDEAFYTLLDSPVGEEEVYAVPDSREGWVESEELLVQSYMGLRGPVTFDYSGVRRRGTPIVKFGGIASGPEPLMRLHDFTRETFDRFLKREISVVRLKADLMCSICVCVVAGGVRRSAGALLGDPDDKEFLDLKDYSKYPERAEIGWATNNSPRLTESRHFALIPEIAARARVNGEPGLVNMINIHKFGRVGKEENPDTADMTNPCLAFFAPVAVLNKGITPIRDVKVGDVIWSGKKWVKVIDHACTGVKSIWAYHTEVGTFYGTSNHRIVQRKEKVEVGQADSIDSEDGETYEIDSRIYLMDGQVYDLTVDDPEHVFVTNGLLVSNCAEIPLCDKETCVISENYPSRCKDEDEFVRAAELACLYDSTVILLPSHRAETNAIVMRNRRIGVGISGVADWGVEVSVAEQIRAMRRAYRAVIDYNRELAHEAGIPPSVRCTTVKPSGSVSLLAGVAPGGHFALGRHYLRRKRVAEDSPVVPLLKAAGYRCEPDVKTPNTLVFEFPISQPGVRTQTEAGMFEQALQLATLQREWSDNSVSFTLEFDPVTEGPRLANLLAQIAPTIKTVSMLPRDTKAYEQPPYEEIGEAKYLERAAEIKPVDWSAYGKAGDGQADLYCSGGICQVKRERKGEA